MKQSFFILLFIFVAFITNAQHNWGTEPRLVKFFTLVNSDTIESHFDSLKPASFTYIRTYYYADKLRSFKEVSGHYLGNQRHGDWTWFLPPISPKSEECCQVGPAIYGTYKNDSLMLRRIHSQDTVIKSFNDDSIGGAIFPPGLKATRFILNKGRSEFPDLNKDEIYFGHYDHLESTIRWFEVETKILLWPDGCGMP